MLDKSIIAHMFHGFANVTSEHNRAVICETLLGLAMDNRLSCSVKNLVSGKWFRKL